MVITTPPVFLDVLLCERAVKPVIVTMSWTCLYGFWMTLKHCWLVSSMVQLSTSTSVAQGLLELYCNVAMALIVIALVAINDFEIPGCLGVQANLPTHHCPCTKES